MAAEAPADRIELRGLRVVATHGARPEEQDRAQPFEVDLDVYLDVAPAGRSDALADTVDYGDLVDRVVAVLGGPHADLLERLAELVCAEVLADDRAQAVTATVRKLRPPVPWDLASAAVTATRRRPPVP
ncbi:MAG: dihydroneopterin aldolase [Acidimicrobiales bacterium]